MYGKPQGLPENIRNMAGLPRYQMGGMVGPQGQPMPPQGAGLQPQGQAGQPPGFDAMQAEVQRVAQQNPQAIQQMQQALMEAMQTGELTQQELNMMIQLATVAAQNPAMYPNVRNFAIQQGLAEEDELPQEYDPRLVMALLIAGQALQQGGGQQPMPAMKEGGTVPKSDMPDGGVPIMAHEGEYVIPKRVVEMKGKEFFDSLVAKYSDKVSDSK
jgi:hypothetical protein